MCFLSRYWKASHVFYIKVSLTLQLCLLIAWSEDLGLDTKSGLFCERLGQLYLQLLPLPVKAFPGQVSVSNREGAKLGVKNRFLGQVSSLRLSSICCSGKWEEECLLPQGCGGQAAMYVDSGASACKEYLCQCWGDLSLLSSESIRRCAQPSSRVSNLSLCQSPGGLCRPECLNQ